MQDIIKLYINNERIFASLNTQLKKRKAFKNTPNLKLEYIDKLKNT